MAMSSPSHEIQSFFTSYLVLHFREVWKCGVVRQSKDIVALSPCYEPFVILYLVPHFVRLFHTSRPLRSVELRMKKKSRDLVASTGHLCPV